MDSFFFPCQSVSSHSFYPSTTSRADCRHFQFLKARSIQFASYSSSQLLSSLHPSLGLGALAERREREGNAPLNCPSPSVVLSPLWVPSQVAPAGTLMPQAGSALWICRHPAGFLAVRISDLGELVLGGLPVPFSSCCGCRPPRLLHCGTVAPASSKLSPRSSAISLAFELCSKNAIFAP